MLYFTIVRYSCAQKIMTERNQWEREKGGKKGIEDKIQSYRNYMRLNKFNIARKIHLFNIYTTQFSITMCIWIKSYYICALLFVRHMFIATYDIWYTILFDDPMLYPRNNFNLCENGILFDYCILGAVAPFVVFSLSRVLTRRLLFTRSFH